MSDPRIQSDEWQVRPITQAIPAAPPRPALPQIVAPFGGGSATGFSVRELRTFAQTLSLDEFRRQLGPFALLQKPSTPLVTQLALRLGAQATGGRLTPDESRELFAALMMEFDYLRVAGLPPLLGNDELSVGRLPDCDLVIDDPSVSKRHAVLRWEGGAKRCRVCDLGSTNGSGVNGVRLRGREAPLSDGDLLTFGDAAYLFQLTETLYLKLLDRSAE